MRSPEYRFSIRVEMCGLRPGRLLPNARRLLQEYPLQSPKLDVYNVRHDIAQERVEEPAHFADDSPPATEELLSGLEILGRTALAEACPSPPGTLGVREGRPTGMDARMCLTQRGEVGEQGAVDLEIRRVQEKIERPRHAVCQDERGAKQEVIEAGGFDCG